MDFKKVTSSSQYGTFYDTINSIKSANGDKKKKGMQVREFVSRNFKCNFL